MWHLRIIVTFYAEILVLMKKFMALELAHHLSDKVSYHILYAWLLLPAASLQHSNGPPQMPN